MPQPSIVKSEPATAEHATWLRLTAAMRHRWRLVTGAIGVLVLATGIIFIAIAASRPTSHAPGVQASATPTPTGRGIPRVALTALIGRPQLTEEQIPESAKVLRNNFATNLMRHRDTAASFYGDATTDLVLVMSTPAHIANPEVQIDKLLRSLQRPTDAAISTINTIEPSPSGVVAKCGSLQRQEGEATVCAWADQETIGLVIWLNRKPTDIHTELASIRSAGTK